MNTNVLNKCLTELQKDKPNIDKVIGMLETIIEMSGSVVPVQTTHTRQVTEPAIQNYAQTDEITEERTYGPHTIGTIGKIF